MAKRIISLALFLSLAAVRNGIDPFAAVCSWSSTAAFILGFIWLTSLPKNTNANA